MRKLILMTVLLAITGFMAWLVWFRPVKEPAEEQKPEADVPVHVGKITRATLRAYVTSFGLIEPEPKANAKIATAVPGVVAAVKCSEGQHVELGTLLFQLDSRAADVAVTYAEKNADRQKRLAQVEGTSLKTLQEAEQQLAAARAQQALLQIRSPLAGIVTKANIKAGEAADLATVLAEVVDLDHLVATVNVSSADLAALRPGQPVEVSTADSTNAINASLSFTSSQVDPKTGSGVARAALPPNCGLRPGQFAKMRVTSEEHKDCLAVPLASVAREPAGGYFIAIIQGDKATLKPVKIGLRDGDLVEVQGEGVEVDATVVTDGAYGLIMTQQFATKIHVVNE